MLFIFTLAAVATWLYLIFKDGRSAYLPPAPFRPDEEAATSIAPPTAATATGSAGEAVKMPPTKIIENVPFTAQAPFGDWDDVKQDYGCEEACLLMAMHWISGAPLSPEYARDQIVAISEFELKTYQHHHDYSITDTQKVLEAYFGHKNSASRYNAGIEDIKAEIVADNLVIIPIDGRLVTNPYFTAPGPFHHQILVIGYDDNAKELIVHDPGTRQGAAFRYAYREIEAAWRDYYTGLNEPIKKSLTAMLVIKK